MNKILILFFLFIALLTQAQQKTAQNGIKEAEKQDLNRGTQQAKLCRLGGRRGG